MDVLKYTQTSVLHGSYDKCDWFTLALFLVYGGSFDRWVIENGKNTSFVLDDASLIIIIKKCRWLPPFTF